MKRIAALVLALVLALTATVSASAASYKKGSKGSGVLRVQQYLNNSGYADLKEDGIYGAATAEAVARFQKKNGLKEDGVAGTKTLKAMGIYTVNDNNPQPSTDDDGNDNSVMQRGSTGPSVRSLQSALKSLNYPVGKVDGSFGKTTEAALKIFQQLNNLKADGKAGSATLTKLFDGSAAAYNKSVKETKYTLLVFGSKDSTANKNAVTRLQKALIAGGYMSGSSTGFYDQATKQAVMDFQADKGIKEDGKAGQETQALLYGN